MHKIRDGWLTGHSIKEAFECGDIIISPFDNSQLNSNSYNYRLSPHLKRLTNEVIDCYAEDEYEEIQINHSGYTLLPNEAYLGSTYEKFGSNIYASLITGRSSIGRKFITNHITAGLIDQGFMGNITLEITVVKPTIIYPLMKFGQIFWFSTSGLPLLYQGKYQHQTTATLSKLKYDI